LYNLIPNARKFKPFPAVGLTHDIGKIILLQYFPERYESILENMKNKPELTFHESELDLGYINQTHTEIGAYFLDWWNLPEIITEVALYHHDVEKATPNYRELLDASYMTDWLTNHISKMVGNKHNELDEIDFYDVSQQDIEEIAYEILDELENNENAF
jgi:HD-like signal output (HDOD) protein